METRSASAKAGAAAGSQEVKKEATFKRPGEPAVTRETTLQDTTTSSSEAGSTSFEQALTTEQAVTVVNRTEDTTTAVSGVSTREMLNQSAQKLVADINSKRKRDSVLLADFKKALEIQVVNSVGLLESSIYKTYETTGGLMQEKLQELFAVLDRVAKLEAELVQFRQALGMLYTDVQAPQKP